jgi:hypothetical protein
MPQHRKKHPAAIGATRRALIEMGRKHGRDIRLVHPAHTTMDCGRCGAGTKHALPLSVTSAEVVYRRPLGDLVFEARR